LVADRSPAAEVPTGTRKPGHPKDSKNKTTEEAFPVEEMVVDVDGERGGEAEETVYSVF